MLDCQKFVTVTNLTNLYGQVNLLWQKSSIASKWASKHLWGNIYFAGDGTSYYFRALVPEILLSLKASFSAENGEQNIS